MRKWRTSARGRTPRRPTSAWLVGLLLAAGPVGAQLPNIPLDRPGEREMPVPRREAPPPKFTVPPLESTEAPLGESGLRVLARGFQFVGNTAFSDVELNRIVAQYIGREIGTQDLEAMRLALTKYYVDRGYVNSGAVVPDQEVVGGVITLRLVEGTLSGIEISGNRRLSEAYLRDRVMLGAATPLNVYKIRDQLFILQQDPRIKRVNAALLPGLRPGEALLRLDVEEQPSRSVHVGVDNRRPPSVGAERAEVEFNDYNFLGYADTFNARYGLTEGLNDVDVSYAFPIDVHDTAITARYVRSDSTVIEAPFDALDVKSETTSAALGVWRPYVKTPAKEYGVGLTFEQRRNQTFLLGEPFAFSPGADANGVSRVAALRLQAAWLTHNPQRIFAGRSTLSFGTGALHATVSDMEPDARFVAWLGQFQWVERFAQRREELVVRADAQLANDPLLSIEQFPLGGAQSVRGYRENQLVRDNGLFASIEYRWALPFDAESRQRLQLAAFYDVGRAWNRERPTPDPRILSSVGVGLRGNYASWLEYELYVGVRLHNVSTADGDLQDHGIHFRLRARVW